MHRERTQHELERGLLIDEIIRLRDLHQRVLQLVEGAQVGTPVEVRRCLDEISAASRKALRLDTERGGSDAGG